MDVILVIDIAEAAAGFDGSIRVEGFRESDLEGIERLIREHNVAPRPALCRVRDCLQQGHHGLVGRREGSIIAYGWYATSGARHPHVDLHRIAIGQNDIFTFDLFVAPEARKGGTAVAFLRGCSQWLSRRGVVRAYTLVLAENRRSLWVHLGIGAREVVRRRVHFWCSWLVSCERRFQLRSPIWF